MTTRVETLAAEGAEQQGAPNGPFPQADRVPAAHDGPLFELEGIGRTLQDLAPGETSAAKRGQRTALIFSAVGFVLMVGFGIWMLIGG